MRMTRAFLYTLREAPADAEVASHVLLARAGFIHKLSSGLYDYAPAMWRSLKKISAIVREEMDRAGGQELMLPIVQPREIWEQSGRWDRYVSDGILFHFADRKDAEVCLGPTHEEVITDLVRAKINTYRQLPVNLYQIQTKMRDEIRPRFGLMRAREFIMKDAYSFDVDEAGLDESYAAMDQAYRAIFRRCGLKFMPVEADPGAIGGSGSQEFMVIADTGEDAILYCDACQYAANVEKAASVPADGVPNGDPRPLRREDTPGVRTVEQLHEFFPDVLPSQMVKTVLYTATYADREQTVAVLMRGDLPISEVKLANALDCLAVQLADDETVKKVTGADVGFAGPLGLPDDVRVLGDLTIRGMTNVLCGANTTDVHCLDVNFGRDLPAPEHADLRESQAGEACPRCGAPLQQARGIEVGHIFKLGTKYSAAMGATFTAEDGGQAPFVMGCYGIGVSRIAASAVEQSHDKGGIVWPLPIAPWQVHLLMLNVKDADQQRVASQLYEQLTAAGIEVLFDDRKGSAGIKFKDADLIGLPLRIVAGRSAKDGDVEVSLRAGGDRNVIPAADALAWAQARIDEALAAIADG